MNSLRLATAAEFAMAVIAFVQLSVRKYGVVNTTSWSHTVATFGRLARSIGRHVVSLERAPRATWITGSRASNGFGTETTRTSVMISNVA